MFADQASKTGKILIAIGSSPNSRYLVRWAQRAAAAFGWEWMAVHIDLGGKASVEDSERLKSHLALARSLGAEVLVREGSDIAGGVIEAARECGAGMIVIGRSGLSRLGVLPRPHTVSDRIVREADPIDVAVVQDSESPVTGLTLGKIKASLASPPKEYALLALVFLLVTGLGILLNPLIGYRSIALVYLATVLGLSFLTRPLPVAIFAIVSALFLNFFYMAPRFTFRIATTEDAFLFITYFLVAFVTGSLVARLRLKDRLLSERERRTAFLLASTQRLSGCGSADEAARAAVSLIRQYRGTEAIFLIPSNGRFAAVDGAGARELPTESIMEGALLAFGERKVCGGGTPFLPSSPYRFIPALAGESAAGVIAVALPGDRPWSISDDDLMLSLGRSFAFISERKRSEELERKTSLAVESERLSKVLLDSVSHELRTPLTTITGSVSALRNAALAESEEARKVLVDGALEASDRLNRIVEDILSMSRIESGNLRLYAACADVADLANQSIAAAGPELDPGRVILSLEEDAGPVRVDIGLFTTLAANLLRNASRYSPPGSPVEFSLVEEDGGLWVQVRDRGPGVPPGDLDSLFERFRRGGEPRSGEPRSGGLGLGLAICKGIAKAHGGTISARNADGGGLCVRAFFPSCVMGDGR